jgi:cyclic dehypoxanthinyl futalosine synthase
MSRLASGATDLIANPGIDDLLGNSAEGQRISVDEALQLVSNASLVDLGLAADARRNQLHPGRRVSYIVERNINYTNVCNVYCRFCAFYRAPGRPGGYILSKEELAAKIDETVAADGIQILLQGGLNPQCGIEYYEDLFRWLKQQYPSINLHALSADEILHVCKISNLSIEEALARLIAAGMGSLPGAGAEILVDHVRKRIARLKCGAEKWLAVHRAAHRQGIPSTCTMMFGVNETWHDRLLHLEMLRELQDETGGFTAFITWPYQQGELRLARGNTSAAEYLRVQAIARLFLDNIPHLQSSWVTQGPSIGQVALSFGADDFGAVMFEENVVSAAGTTFRMNSDFIESQIRRAGYTPWRRNVRYQEAGKPTDGHAGTAKEPSS